MRKCFSGFSLSTWIIAAVLAAGTALAQGPPPPQPKQLEKEPQGESAGGKWYVFQSEDPMTAAKLVTFQIESDNTTAIAGRGWRFIARTASTSTQNSSPAFACQGRTVRDFGDSRRWKSGFAWIAPTIIMAGTG